MPERKMLDVTTAHLRRQDRHVMEALAVEQNAEDGFPRPHVYKQEYGWYISTGIMYGESVEDGENDLREAGFSEEFIKLIVHAHSLDCALVNFDSDGDLEPGFEVFDQETDEPTDPATFRL
jgi:hypothetical protein